MTALTDNELQAINNRCEAATPGPFTIIEPIQAEDEDGNCIHGAYSYPGGIEDANGDAVCTFGSENGSGHMFEHKANKVFLSNARTDIPALLGHIEAQNAALDQAWYVLDAAAAGKAPRSAAIMARANVEKFIRPRESNFDDATKEAPVNDATKIIAQAICGILTPCSDCGSRKHCEITMLKATGLYTAHIKPLEDALTKAEADKAALVEALSMAESALSLMHHRKHADLVQTALSKAIAALASVRGVQDAD